MADTRIVSAAAAKVRHSPSQVLTLCVCAFLLMGGLAHATTISMNTLVINAGDPTQLGRLSRDGTPSDWSTTKAFPGVINTTTSYHFKTLDLDLVALESAAGFLYGGFIQLDFDSTAATTFLSAYVNAYDPLNPSVNYLGDSGFSGNPFPGDPGFFQVVVPAGQHLVLLLNETTPNGGIGLPGTLTVEAFADSAFTDLEPVPEPGTLALLFSGTAVLLKMRRRRARFNNQ